MNPTINLAFLTDEQWAAVRNTLLLHEPTTVTMSITAVNPDATVVLHLAISGPDGAPEFLDIAPDGAVVICDS